MRPFDYAELRSGDLACVMWDNQAYGGTVAYPWYSTLSGDVSSNTDALFVLGRYVTKIYRKGYRAPLDEHIRNAYPSHAITDAVGGLMVRLTTETVCRHLDGVRHLAEAITTRTPLDVRPLLDALKLSTGCTGTTGSWLLGTSQPSDLDLVVHDVMQAAETADIIRRLLREQVVERLPGYWGRSFHHRRFRFRGWKICVRCPAPPKVLNDFTVAATGAAAVDAVGCTVVDASYSHCTPSIYQVRMLDEGSAWDAGCIFPLVSSDGSHAFAFEAGTRLRLRNCSLYRSRNQHEFLACHLGNPEGVTPDQEQRA
jgi:hypothetical protein